MRKLNALLTLVLLLVMPVLLALNAVSLALVDLAWKLFGRRRPPEQDTGKQQPVRCDCVSVVIPTWNGRDLLEQYLPSVVKAASFHPDNEIIVVDNASEDGTAEFIGERFPRVRLLRLEKNLGFGGGNNAGVAAARHDVVVVLNNDMRVDPDTFQKLLEGFRGREGVFAVSAQIFLRDPSRRREETGLTEGVFRSGFLQVGHVVEDETGLYPTFYAGGGSSAFDRRKYLELGGFDPLFHPFYLEDTDLSYLAWKRGWQVLYQPAAIVHHEHRGTIGRRFTAERIDAVLKKNHALMVWKNVHRWSWLWQHWLFLFAGAWVSFLSGTTGTRATPAGYAGAVRQWGQALVARWRARSLAVLDDEEALRRSQAGYYRDRFLPPRPADPEPPLDILFVAPYSLYPPTHGGGVFMYQAVRALARRHRVHVLALVDREEEVASNRRLEEFAASVECLWRNFPPPRDYRGLEPYGIRCFTSDEFRRRVQRALFRHNVDVLQLEYTQLGLYGGGLRHTPSVLFEHDVYFQSVRRRLLRARSFAEFVEALVEWLRALRWELSMLRRMEVVQTCSEEERRLLESLLGRKTPPQIVSGVRAAVEVASYPAVYSGRRPHTALFVGNFQHLPNHEALRFLVREVLPRLRAARPQAELVVVGAEAGGEILELARSPGVRFLGRVEDIREPLARYAAFLCPIFAGSGVRVKIMEAFASGIPVVSTPLGAEGLDTVHGRELLLARTAAEFVSATLEVFDHPERAELMARRARQVVEERWDWKVVAPRLEQCYRDALSRCRPSAPERESAPMATMRSG